MRVALETLLLYSRAAANIPDLQVAEWCRLISEDCGFRPTADQQRRVAAAVAAWVAKEREAGR